MSMLLACCCCCCRTLWLPLKLLLERKDVAVGLWMMLRGNELSPLLVAVPLKSPLKLLLERMDVVAVEVAADVAVAVEVTVVVAVAVEVAVAVGRCGAVGCK